MMNRKDVSFVLSQKVPWFRSWEIGGYLSRVHDLCSDWHDKVMGLHLESKNGIWFVVDTWEIAVFSDCVIKAVNLGDDTDTVGAVAGGIADVFYGVHGIRSKWIDILPKKDWINQLSTAMFDQYL